MTVLTNDQLGETHPMLKPDFRRSMQAIRRRGGPWECPSSSCSGPSYQCYRCSKCGHNLVDSSGSAGRMGANR